MSPKLRPPEEVELERTGMSTRELQRAEVMGRVRSKGLKLINAAEILELSYRQSKRLWRRYRQEGAKGLKHRSAGKSSNRAKPEKFREKVLRRIREKYSGTEQRRFGPTLAAEHLAEEDGLQVNEETLRRWMLAEGLWSRSRRRKAHRKRRERKAHFGELVQLDGSFHEWFEERGPRGCLMNMVDDATGTTLCRMGEQETIWAAVGVLGEWIGQYGVPRALYTDWKNVYKRQPTERERLRGEAPTTQFGRMCARLGIRIIAASSPQAKGRVERNNGVHQDRLVKKLRRQGIQSYQATNEYLEAEYLPEHNDRFAREAAEAEDYHGKAPSPSRLRELFRFETERWVSNDWVIQYRGRHLQLQPRSRRYGPTEAKAVVCEWEEGGIEVRYRGERIDFQELTPATKQQKQQPPARKIAVRRYGATKPAKKDHPWRQGYDRSLLPEQNRAGNFAVVGVPASAAP
jgi:transposase